MDEHTYALRIAEGRRHAATGSGREIRTRARLSLSEVAAAIGTSEVSISRWERRLRQPRGRGAANWAIFLEKVSREIAIEKTVA